MAPRQRRPYSTPCSTRVPMRSNSSLWEPSVAAKKHPAPRLDQLARRTPQRSTAGSPRLQSRARHGGCFVDRIVIRRCPRIGDAHFSLGLRILYRLGVLMSSTPFRTWWSVTPSDDPGWRERDREVIYAHTHQWSIWPNIGKQLRVDPHGFDTCKLSRPLASETGIVEFASLLLHQGEG